MGVARHFGALAALAALPACATAGEPARLIISQASVSLPELKLYVDIPDAQGQPAAGVNPSDLTASLAGQPLTVTAVQPFASAGEGVAYTFLIDISKSIAPAQFDEIRQQVKLWISNMNAADRAALLTIGDNVNVVADFSSDRSALGEKLDRLQPRDSKTLLHRGLVRALEFQHRNDQDLPARRVIVVLSDGKDEGSGLALEDVLQQIREARLPVYAIGSSRLRPSERDLYLNNLHRIANASGGVFLEARSRPLADSYAALNQAIRQVFAVRLSCGNCLADGRTYPVQLDLSAGGREFRAGIDVVLSYSHPAHQAPAPWWKRQRWPAYVAAGALVLGILVFAIVLARRGNASRRPREVQLDVVKVAGEHVLLAKQPPGLALVRKGVPLRLVALESKEFAPCDLRLVDRVTIGRGKDCDVVVPHDDLISNQHCELALVQGAIVIRDLESMNGTELNGVPVTSRCRVLSGDRISVGDTQFRVSFQEPL